MWITGSSSSHLIVYGCYPELAMSKLYHSHGDLRILIALVCSQVKSRTRHIFKYAPVHITISLMN